MSVSWKREIHFFRYFYSCKKGQLSHYRLCLSVCVSVCLSLTFFWHARLHRSVILHRGSTSRVPEQVSIFWRFDIYFVLQRSKFTDPILKQTEVSIPNISQTMRDIDLGCITYRQEIIYGLSFHAMTFDLESPWKVKQLEIIQIDDKDTKRGNYSPSTDGLVYFSFVHVHVHVYVSLYVFQKTI